MNACLVCPCACINSANTACISDMTCCRCNYSITVCWFYDDYGMREERERRALKALPARSWMWSASLKHNSGYYKTLMRSITKMILIINLGSEWNLCCQVRLIHNFTDCLNESRRYVFHAARAFFSNRSWCINHKNMSILPWIPVWWDIISLGGGCLETLDPGRRKRSGGDVTCLWGVAPPSALRMRGHHIKIVILKQTTDVYNTKITESDAPHAQIIFRNKIKKRFGKIFMALKIDFLFFIHYIIILFHFTKTSRYYWFYVKQINQ